MLEDYYRQYGLVLMLSVVAVVIPSSLILVSWALQRLHIRPSKPTDVKSDIYECGMEVIGGRWVQFNFRYYIYALLFLLFDVTAVFIYPWAIRQRDMGAQALFSMMGFVGILAVGWVYAWRKGALDWK